MIFCRYEVGWCCGLLRPISKGLDNLGLMPYQIITLQTLNHCHMYLLLVVFFFTIRKYGIDMYVAPNGMSNLIKWHITYIAKTHNMSGLYYDYDY